MIVGTAGHIDHGKTTLVRAITGVDTDRLKEEKARGISIELGYAYTPLSNGEVLGFVDVPGHERLVHTMASGACGIDFALLVVAADDGVMPQTREHVAILQFFGIARGAVALTKVDRVEEARVRLVESEVKAFLAGSFLEGAPVFKVGYGDSSGGTGVRTLREHLEKVATRRTSAADSATVASSAAARDARLFRLAVDRVFTLAGHGTVVAGTVFSGSVQVGDQLTIFPATLPVRVRSIHAQNRPAEAGHSGERCALTLAGVEKHQVKRGDWLADPCALSPTTRIDVRLQLLDNTSTVLKSWIPLHFHHGAAHLPAHVVPLESATIHAGQSSYAQIVFDTPICAAPGDRFVLRDTQAQHTLGGGVVVDPYGPTRRRRSPERMRYLDALERLISEGNVSPLLEESPHGIKQSQLTRLCGAPPTEAPANPTRSPSGAATPSAQTPRLPSGTLPLPEGAMNVEGIRDRYILLSSTWCRLLGAAVEALRKFHADMPDEPGPDVGRLRRVAFPKMPDDVWHAIINQLVSDGTIMRSGPWIYMPGHAVTLSETEATLARKLQPLISAGRFNPPWVRDLATGLHEPEEQVRRVLRKQVTQGAVYQVVHDLFYDRQCVNELAAVVTELANEHGAVEAAQYRDALGLGRKRAVQILEFFDRVGHTRRIRDTRVLRSDSTWRAA